MVDVQAKNQRQFYLHGNLHKILHISRARDLLTAYDFAEGKTKVYPWSEVQRRRQHAFTITQAGALLDRHRDRIMSYMEEGNVPWPQREYSLETGRPGRYFFSEDDMMDLRDYVATVHIGRPRKDGKVTNNRIPTREELRAMMQQGRVLYVKENDEFVPVWKAKEF